MPGPGHRDYESCEPTWKHEAQALDRCKARRAERKEHRHGCTERGCQLDRDSVQRRSTFGSSDLELAPDEQ